MSEYIGISRDARVRIVGNNSRWLQPYLGQECDAIFYEGGIKPQINSEQLNPPVIRYQSVFAEDLQEIK